MDFDVGGEYCKIIHLMLSLALELNLALENPFPYSLNSTTDFCWRNITIYLSSREIIYIIKEKVKGNEVGIL